MNLQKTMIGFRTPIQLLRLPHYQSRKDIVQNVPQEIIEIVFAFLSVPDRVCFSLSCKHIFACLHSFLEAQNTRLPQLLPREKRSVLCPNAKKRPRNQLLLRLENNRWKYCSDCWVLHPHTKWWARFLSGPYCPKCHLFPERTCSILPAGEVDICPCLSITFRDKLHLMETCKCAQGASHQGREYYYNNILYHSFGGRLQHECTFMDHPFAKVEVHTILSIEGKNTSLHVQTRYKFEILQESASGMKTPFICLHKDTGNWLRRFFDEAGSSFLGWPRYNYSRSLSCDWSDWRKSMTGEGPYSFEITVNRNLGNDKWPNKFWNRNRRH